MRKVKLGQTDLMVSELCLGSMTWGTQNTEAEGHAQIDMALDRGVNFIDTAEMYPVNPVRPETVGLTEQIIGNWIAKSGRRDDVIVATKIIGAGSKAARDGAPITPQALTEAVDASLTRLKTDVIDLYQMHWPNRGSYHFRQNWGFDPSPQNREEVRADMTALLERLDALVKEGKIKHVGLSNETAWGTSEWLRIAGETGAPRMQSIQNEYSLLCRHYDLDMAELGHHEQVTLLAYTPLAGGLLSGKYAGDVIPEGSRRSLNHDLGGRMTPRVFSAVSAYLGIAADHGLDPVQMALAWTMSRPFPIVPIIGATNLEQLDTVLGSAEVSLSNDVLSDIGAAYKAHPLPF